MDPKLKTAIDALAKLPKTDIKGKQYATVASRVEVFRNVFGLDYGINTEAFDTPDLNVVRVSAKIVNAANGVVVASGWAQEDMTANKINFTSSLEVAETSAIGRALANFGLLGGEYASANEMHEAMAVTEPVRSVAKMPTDRAQTSRPQVNQYNFHIPNSASKEDIDKVFFQIDGILDLDTLTAYYNELSPLLPHLPPEEEAEIVGSFKDRKKQLKGQ